ncbi:RTA1 like protein-domain-containing protein [Truncatella angustata]|uniref:RTA1 like protein-domain-containing protein n=1 Tax=Truncatella angustata TaxID=152316 RepID=A0A9P8RF28_9PEZI|nr:RTA1 like protein-domain-containing protein [Truncatella angustata]KAH6643427.1 RTA1 like protein-domain-containing protein [Truncatella angustata]
MNSANNTNATAAATEGFDFKLYRYELNLPAAIVAVVIFSVLSILHLYKIVRHRALYFTAFTIGGFFQVVGYAGRIWSHYSPTALGGFIMQAILILVAPALYAASIYMILGRLVRALRAERLSVVSPRWMTRIFVIGDVISFSLQAGGGGIQAGGSLKMYELGEKIIIVGLFVQIVMFGLFVVTAILFHRRQSRYGVHHSSTEHSIPWKKHLWVLYSVSTLILIRSIFRVVEYLQGNKGYLISHEVFLYCFDALLMAAVMAVLLVFYVHDLDFEHCEKRESGVDLMPSSESDGVLEMGTQPHKHSGQSPVLKGH